MTHIRRTLPSDQADQSNRPGFVCPVCPVCRVRLVRPVRQACRAASLKIPKTYSLTLSSAPAASSLSPFPMSRLTPHKISPMRTPRPRLHTPSRPHHFHTFVMRGSGVRVPLVAQKDGADFPLSGVSAVFLYIAFYSLWGRLFRVFP